MEGIISNFLDYIFTFNLNWHVAVIFSILNWKIKEKIVLRHNFVPAVLPFCCMCYVLAIQE